jgi:hypothetical protein
MGLKRYSHLLYIQTPNMTEIKQTAVESLREYLSSIRFPDEIFTAQDHTSVFRYLTDHPVAFSRVTRKNRDAGTFTEPLYRTGDIVHSIESEGPIMDVIFIVSNWTSEQMESGDIFKEGVKYGNVCRVKLTDLLEGRLELSPPTGLPVMWLPYTRMEIQYTAIGTHTFKIHYATIQKKDRDMGDRSIGLLMKCGIEGNVNYEEGRAAACQGMELTVGGRSFVIDRFRLMSSIDPPTSLEFIKSIQFPQRVNKKVSDAFVDLARGYKVGFSSVKQLVAQGVSINKLSREIDVIDSFESDCVMDDVSLLIEYTNTNGSLTGKKDEIQIAECIDNFPFKFCSPHGLPMCSAAYQRVSLKYQAPRIHTLRINGCTVSNTHRVGLGRIAIPCTIGAKDFVLECGAITDIKDAKVPLTYETGLRSDGRCYG